MSCAVYLSESMDAYFNLAAEEYLFSILKENDIALFLWRNEPSVIIGRNQNAWKECNLKAIFENGAVLCRRKSGGGAVYHDAGNLNFSFLAGKTRYDVQKQFDVILDALGRLGIESSVSGRNDLVANGKKFSGNAFRVTKTKSYHHGTLLVDADLAALERYLLPPENAIYSKGIESVRSRVVNLAEILPFLNIEMLKEGIIGSFRDSYDCKGCSIRRISESGYLELFAKEIKAVKAFGWKYGNTPAFCATYKTGFEWGDFEISFFCKRAVIRECTIRSSADKGWLETLCASFVGVPFVFRDIRTSLLKEAGKTGDKRISDVADWLSGKNI